MHAPGVSRSAATLHSLSAGEAAWGRGASGCNIPPSPPLGQHYSSPGLGESGALGRGGHRRPAEDAPHVWDVTGPCVWGEGAGRPLGAQEDSGPEGWKEDSGPEGWTLVPRKPRPAPNPGTRVPLGSCRSGGAGGARVQLSESGSLICAPVSGSRLLLSSGFSEEIGFQSLNPKKEKEKGKEK